ncbi:PREDICTED: WD repeat-containing protein 19 [Papilio polytes]|uniref:WD repeat-containing protein 19 n=1 Tax=Papilio polytes TaxID=76194 RepID=UPI000675DDBA|nr:PREDICTED: WD repeat-containing protein 19 [Papilio polytes]
MTTPKLLYSLDQPHGMGELYFLWQKGESRSLLATTGTDATVAIHDRSGQLVERIKLQGLCAAMQWDNDGDYLAVITPNSSTVLLWECHTNKRLNIETGLRESPSCLAWAFGEPLLAVGTQKGNLALYNHHTTKRIPIIGKHTKKITSAAWNRDSILILASEDKSLSINNSDGDTLRIITLRDVPNDLQFSEMKTDERVAGENTISLVVGKRTLYLYNLLNPENPIELAFQQRYGSIVSYKWYGDGYILIGFSAGYIIAISTHLKEVGEELFQVKNHKDNLTDIAVFGDQAASCGDGQLKLISLWNNGEVSCTVAVVGGAERCAFSAGTGGTDQEESEGIGIAIDAAAASDDERLTRRLIEFLLGETDGTPRDPRHLFRLYMAKKQFTEAAKTAVIISSAECLAGRYREARAVSRGVCAALRARGAAVPRDLRTALAVLHTYILVRTHVKRGRHELAARLLLRTANDVAFFPTHQHQVSILTSTVIECSRAGLKHQAHHWARVLMQPEYRSQVYIVKGDLTACPECDFPAIYSEFVELLQEEGKCPMCGENVDYRRLVKIDDVSLYLDTKEQS